LIPPPCPFKNNNSLIKKKRTKLVHINPDDDKPNLDPREIRGRRTKKEIKTQIKKIIQRMINLL